MAKRDDKKEEALWRQAAAGDVHALARLLNIHYSTVLANLRKLNRLQLLAASAVEKALDDAIVDLLLTQPDTGKNGIANDWYNLAKVLASRNDRAGRQARGEAIERLTQAKLEAMRLRSDKEAAARRKNKSPEGRVFCQKKDKYRSSQRNSGQRFRSGAVLNDF